MMCHVTAPDDIDISEHVPVSIADKLKHSEFGCTLSEYESFRASLPGDGPGLRTSPLPDAVPPTAAQTGATTEVAS